MVGGGGATDVGGGGGGGGGGVFFDIVLGCDGGASRFVDVGSIPLSEGGTGGFQTGCWFRRSFRQLGFSCSDFGDGRVPGNDCVLLFSTLIGITFSWHLFTVDGFYMYMYIIWIIMISYL